MPRFMRRSWRSDALAARTTISYFLPMARVIVVAFEGVQTLDLTGPAEVFAAAGRVRGKRVYEVVIASTSKTALTTSCGLAIATRPLPRVRATDTIVVAGGDV